MSQKIRIVVIVVAAVLTLIVVLQNTETVDTKLLFMTVSMPRAALLFGTFAAGFLIGLLTSGRIRRQSKK